MESKGIDYLLQQTAAVVFMGIVIYVLYKWVQSRDKEHLAERKEWLKELTALIESHKLDIKSKDLEIKELNKTNRDMSLEQLKFVHDVEDALAKSDPREAMNRILLITQNIADHFKIKTH
ncbi:hypothetical protein AHMF7605_11635 [Adhaeribacter arboris]|uniref:Uncharacterized protein n=1 Tax=Adhaeribacter arboris TaxID=2072846 RepID=A0A2T2YF61_9BACT|nr:hypothetical protein [Adhaeribacter arboris]PSR54123.1 hypothetical protein AHMF7605_11635 [Adhaeribacter arboris]